MGKARMFPEDRHYRAVADFTYDWESWHGLDGRLLWVNRAVARFVGYTPEECLQMADYPLELVEPDDRPQVQGVLDSGLARESGNDVEYRVVTKDGLVKWMAVSWQPIFEGEECLGFRTSVRDITERRKLRDEIKLYAEHLEQLVQERTARIQQLEWHRRQMERSAAMGQLAARVAHEINNPLAGIRNAFTLIKSDVTPGAPHYELLELVDREIERISTIVHQMYQLYRGVPQLRSAIDLRRVVRDVTRLLGTEAAKHEIPLRVEVPEELPRAWLPEGEVTQILFNLIRNAMEASPRGAPVEVVLTCHGEEQRVTVRDRGEGIPDDRIAQIFEPFFTTKTTHGNSGMGLGLSVSKNLIESMGGRIELQTAPGEGSAFAAVFPVMVGETEEMENG